jgi:hypothetical protein
MIPLVIWCSSRDYCVALERSLAIHVVMQDEQLITALMPMFRQTPKLRRPLDA